MSEPFDDWPCKFDMTPEQQMDLDDSIDRASDSAERGGSDFTFPCDAVRESEVIETKIMVFLDEKVSRHRGLTI